MPGKQPRIAQNSVGKTGAHSHEKITVFDSQSRRVGAMHTQHAHIAGVGLVKPALAHKRAGYRRIQLFHKSFKSAGGLRGNHTAAAVNKRPFRSLQKLQRLLKPLLNGKGNIKQGFWLSRNELADI